VNGSVQEPPARRAAFVAVVSAACAAAAWFLFRTGFRGVIYDSFHYLTLGRIVSSEGLWNLASRVRSYGYPLFIALATRFADVSDDTARQLVFAAQLLIHLATAFYAARAAERAFGTPPFFYGTFLCLAANPFALIHSTELLSDSLSASLLALAFFSSLKPSHPARRAFVSFLWAGLAVAVRPANAVVVPALAILWAFRAWLYRERVVRAILPAVGAVALALLPQLVSNLRWYDTWSPLPVERIYGEQVGWGMSILKYGTLVMPDRLPTLVYGNPFCPPGVSSPLQFASRQPLGYLATLALHGFALFDQDLPFTYVVNPKPAYRWPLSLLNYAYLFLCIVGMVVGLFRCGSASPSVKLYFSGAAVVCAAYVALYLPVAVESRFSLPVYLLLGPACVFAVAWLSQRRSGTLVALVIAGGGFLAVCVQLSLWMTRQAPVLQELVGR
jgi:glycosyl transferase family 22 (putative mannosyltransferase)